MNLLDLLRAVRGALLAQRFRAMLTLLGIIIGAGSIVLVASLLQGGSGALTRMNQGLSGANLLQVVEEPPPDALREKTTRRLSVWDVEALSESAALKGLRVSGTMQRWSRAYHRGKSKRITLVGLTPEALDLYQLALERGRFVDAVDEAEARRVAVVGHEVWQELLQEQTDLRRLRVSVEGVSWAVVGVLAHKPSMSKGNGTQLWNRRVLVPRAAFDAALANSRRLTTVHLELPNNETLKARRPVVQAFVERLLLRRHLGVRNFKFAAEDGGGQEKMILLVVQLLLLSTGALALFVGGINIMNIMLVTVSERMKEIGIRRAVGAAPRWIVLQFLSEAALISLVGGVTGVIAGTTLSWLITLMLEQALGAWTFHLVPWSVAAGLGLSVLTGVTFGLLPALRAARLDVVEALRTG